MFRILECILTFMMAVFLFFGIHEVIEYNKYSKNCVQVSAVIVNHESHQYTDERTEYRHVGKEGNNRPVKVKETRTSDTFYVDYTYQDIQYEHIPLNYSSSDMEYGKTIEISILPDEPDRPVMVDITLGIVFSGVGIFLGIADVFCIIFDIKSRKELYGKQDKIVNR